MMLNIENLVVSSIFLLFPLSIYLIYVAYVRNNDLNEKSYFLDLAILSSLLLTLGYQIKELEYTVVLSSITLLIAYLKKHPSLALLISIILIVFYRNYLNLNIYLLIFEYLIYFVAYKLSKTSKNMINSFICIKAFFTSFFLFYNINPNANILYNIISIFTQTSLFITFAYIITYLFRKAQEIVDLNVILEETKREQKLYQSLSKLTHELKNPIAVCKGYLEMIDRRKKNQTEKYLPIISSEINRALEVINDFSSLGKLKTINKEEVDLYLVMDEIVFALQPLFKKRKDELIFIKNAEEDELYIELDYCKIKQVLVNVIKNCLEAKKDDNKLKVEISIVKTRKIIKIVIKDNGTGMSKETLDKIDEIFYTTKENGNGLGVALSKEIVNLHKGTMTYKSALGKGTTVFIKLPLEQSY